MIGRRGRQTRDRGGLRSTCALLVALVYAAAAGPAGAGPEEDRALEGKALYLRFCASCHGTEGHGESIVGQYIDIEIPDLTRIAERRGGWFPDALVRETIDGRHAVHGARQMPVWGHVLSAPQASAITEYLYWMQVPLPGLDGSRAPSPGTKSEGAGPGGS
ncbi:MAG: cytochrome c [Myxococcales bacterium]|nr:cytochrome c [Myxococcales bacterium]